MPRPELKRFPFGHLLGAVLAGLIVGTLKGSGGLGAYILPLAVGILLSRLWSVGKPRAAWKGFAFAWLAGVIAFGIQLRWLSVVSPVGAIVLPLYLALFWGAFGAFASTLGNPFRHPLGIRSSRIGVTFANAAVFAFLEWLRSWLFTGFGWNGLGIVYHDNAPFRQFSDILGVPGISLAIVWLGGLAVVSQHQWKLAGRWHAAPKNIFLAGLPNNLAACALVALVFGYGHLRIHQEKSRETTPLRALLVQINIPQDAAQYLWDPAEIHIAYEEETLAALEKAKAAGTYPDWVIWPESALTGRFLRTDDGGWGTWRENSETLANVHEGRDFTLMFGAVELEAALEGDALIPKTDGATWNSLIAISPEGGLQTFRKHHLVIFGETIPFVDSIPLLKEIYKQQAGVEYGGSFAPGTSFEPLTADVRGTEVGIIPTVCFEDTVPRLTRRFLKPGPQIIVNVTNDGWFKESIAAAQHFANARFRAIELRRPMIRCANTGVTAAITPTGDAVTLTDKNGSHFTRGSLLTDIAIPLKPGNSLYGLIGDWGIIATGLLGFGIAWASRKAGKRPPEPETVV